MKSAATVEEYLAALGRWQGEVRHLRGLLLAAGLEEAVKWGGPCYTVNGKNVVGIGAFKSYFGLWFFQGALLEDEDKVLVNAQQGRTKAMRQWRMTSAADIRPALIKRYLREAMAGVGLNDSYR